MVEPKHRKHHRAARLRREAANCIRIALSERDRDIAALLINEARKLKARAMQLSAIQSPA
jgi:hypothetical protein